MRLHFELSPNIQPVPFDYQHFLTGVLHKWLGNNTLHDGLSLYSLSWLTGSQRVNEGLSFPSGAKWFVSAHDQSLIQQIADAAMLEPDVCCGMKVLSMHQQRTPDFGSSFTFKVASPVLARGQKVDGKVEHFVFSDAEANEVLTQTLRHKLDLAGLSEHTSKASVRFDRSYRNARTKLVTINGIGNRASVCPVIVEGTPEAVQFAWNVGAGHLTGSAFGSLL